MDMNVFNELFSFSFLQIISLFILISGVVMLFRELKKNKKDKSRLIASIIVILGGLFYFVKHIVELKL